MPNSGVPVPTFVSYCEGLDRANIGQTGLRKAHAVRDMARLADVEIERENRARIALLGPPPQPAERGFADLGTKQPALGADDGVAGLGDGQDIANQLLTAFGDGQCAAPQAIDEIDLLNRIDAQVSGQPELVDAAADIAVAIFEQVEIFLHPLGTDAPRNFLID